MTNHKIYLYTVVINMTSHVTMTNHKALLAVADARLCGWRGFERCHAFIFVLTLVIGVVTE